ncbi:hypothetical protein EX30DRAFT_345912 [Ascodesmis nigricans]|uniref:Uncharacterized protein n=1 Tax=Ascodesmis nigricans TaxID=341454 RepID=A0A4V3SJU5_9PEZI|nr:hypothetical protein EX30DRAFT_345912 [Ascodesmis nigricans]
MLNLLVYAVRYLWSSTERNLTATERNRSKGIKPLKTHRKPPGPSVLDQILGYLDVVDPAFEDEEREEEVILMERDELEPMRQRVIEELRRRAEELERRRVEQEENERWISADGWGTVTVGESVFVDSGKDWGVRSVSSLSTVDIFEVRAGGSKDTGNASNELDVCRIRMVI